MSENISVTNDYRPCEASFFGNVTNHKRISGAQDVRRSADVFRVMRNPGGARVADLSEEISAVSD